MTLRDPARDSSPQSQPGSTSGLLDNHGRRITYLRLAITDRCNLRCRYCRPEKGVPFIPHEEILSFEEMSRLVALLCQLGVSKVRVTGGEPFARKGCLSFLRHLRHLPGVEQLHITTNGVATGDCLDQLADIGVDGINLSLDTLDPKRFWQITRRASLEPVLATLHGILARGIPLKINTVALPDTSDQEMLSLIELTRQSAITLRFIETMPFSGGVRSEKLVNGNLIKRLQRILPDLEEHTGPGPATARLFCHSDYKGKIGVIQGFSRQFCATCNKLRITPVGMLKTCLYDNGALDLKRLLRTGVGDQEIREALLASVQRRFANGHEAERLSGRESEPSMANIGG